jgi:hypothetical protein
MTNPLRKLWRAATPSHSTSKQHAAPRSLGNELLVNDRRAAKRHFYPLPATLRYGVAATEERVGIYNFSEKGLCFRSDVRFAIGALLEITAKLPQKPLFDGRTVRYFVRVKRVTLERGQFTVGAVIDRSENLSQAIDSATTRAGQHLGTRQRSAMDRKPKSGSLQARTAGKVNKAAKREPVNGRQFSRYSCATQAQFRTPGSAGISSGEVVNLSLGGCYVQSSEPCPVGTSLELVMQVGRNRIYAQGRVIVVNGKNGMGVEFESSLRDCLQRLPRFIKVVSSGRQARDHGKN